MRIVLGGDLGDGGFPGPLAGRAAALDEAWVDVAGLVALLEVRLGIATRDPPGEAERAAALAKALRDAGPAPWTRSLEVDPLATARAVLRLKDALTLAGVDDAVDADRLPGRLAAVHRLARGTLPGVPERLLACLRALREGGRARVDRLELVDDPAVLPLAARHLIHALAADGTDVRTFAARAVDDDRDSDLAAARGSGEAVYVGDGSLLLLRPDTVEEAAADVAFALPGLPGPVVVIGGDLVLDEALARVGAPPLGARGDVGSDALLSLLPLVVALGEPTVDPERLFEATSLPVTVFPRGLAGRIRRALAETPSALAPKIVEAVVAAVAERGQKHGAAAEAALADRLATLVPAWAPALGRPTTTTRSEDGAVDVAAVRARAVVLVQLLGGRQQRDFGDEERTPYRAAMRQVGVFIRLLDALGTDVVTPPQLARLVRSATASVRAAAPWAASAGLTRLARPGAVLGPAPTIVWWGFTRESGRLPPRTLLVDERQRLRQLGFDPGAIDAIAAGFAEATRRPLLYARDRLILVAPQRGPGGREHHPHPLWDEILARAPAAERRAATRNLVRPDDDGARGLVPRVAPVPRPMMRPRGLHEIGANTVHPREVTSPSREELLLGCGLRFVLEERGAQARPLRVKRGVTLEGEVVHAVISAVLGAGIVDTDDDVIAARARSAFVDVVPRLAGDWLRPGREQIMLRVRERAARATVALVATLRDNQLTVQAVEQEVARELPTPVQGAVLQRMLKGTPDLVVVGVDSGRPFPFVIDHKTGREEHRRTLLRLGVPLQLLAYARLVGDKTMAPPGFGYFIIRSRRLLTSDSRLHGVELVPADRTAREGWGLIEAARREAFDALARGEVRAPGADDEVPDEIAVGPDRVVIGPPCRWCRADVVCGAGLKETLHG
jgi:ATP-dependent helicase/nuclease subunit B